MRLFEEARSLVADLGIEFGADLALDSGDPAWPEAVRKATGDRGVDLIVDQVSASVANQNMQAAAILGKAHEDVDRLFGGGRPVF